ncbi:hypothetical protein ACW9VY_05540 [Lactiplantibacillus plantarum]
MAESNATQVILTDDGLKIIKAQNTADNANGLAETADGNIKNINDPNYLSPFEKPQLEIQMDNFATNYATDKDIATSEGIDFTAYDAAYQAYLAYMTPLIADMTTYSPIVRATFNSMVTAVQAEQKRFSTATQAQYNQQIKQAQTDIDDSQTKYKDLQSEAKTMESSVASISDAADQAISSAGFASNAASAASQVASSAVVSALSAQSDASTAAAQASSAAADSKDAKQIAGAVSQSYKTLTDGSTMTIAELEGGLAAKLTKTDLDGYSTQTWTQNQIKMTADGINGTISSVKSTVDSQTTSINNLQADSSGFKAQFTTVNDTLGKHTTDIGTLQASSKELTSNFNSLSTDNNTNKNDISQLKQTATEVSSTLETVQTQVQNSAVGTNLLVGTSSSEKSYTGDFSTTPDWSFDSTSVNKYVVNVGSAYTYSIYLTKLTGSFVLGYWGYDSNKNYVNWIPSSFYSSSGKVSWTFTVPSGISYIFPHVVHASDDFTCTAKEEKLELGSHATDWCLNPTETATVTAVSSISQTVKGIQETVSDKVSSSQLTQLSSQFTSKINTLSSSISSQFSQTSNDINAMVKKGDVVNQFNLDAGGALLSTSGNSTKIVFSSPNIIFDSNNPVQIPNANIPGTLTGKTFETGTITATTKITGSDIEAPIIHSPSGSFKLDGNTGDIIGASIHSDDNSWGIDKNGNINGSTINGGTINMQNDGIINSPYTGIVQTADQFYHPWNLKTGQLTIGQGYITSVSSGTRSINGVPKQFDSLQGTLSASYLKFTNNYGARTYIDADMFTYSNQTNDTAMVAISASGIGVNMGTPNAPALTISNGYIDASSSSSYGTFGAITLGYNAHTINSDGSLFFESGHGSGNPGINIWAKGFQSLSSRLSTKRQVRLLDDEHSNGLLLGADTATFKYNQDTNADNSNEGVIIDDVNTVKQYSLPDELITRDGKAPTDLMSFIARVISQNKYQARLIEDLQIRLRKVEIKNEQ